MKHKTILFLETDSIDWCETVRVNLERQRNKAVSQSEAVDYVIQTHWRKKIRQLVDQKHADKVQDRLKGSKLIKPNLAEL
jgi:hypothetical protein